MPHILDYGPSGTGKSVLAASSDTTQLIAFFDSLDEQTGGNARPYFVNCLLRKDRDVVIVNGRPSIIPTYLCYSQDDPTILLRKLWHFNPALPEGISQFKVKWALLEQELSVISAKTFILDSLTTYQMAGRMYAREVSPVYNKDGSLNEEQIAYQLTDHLRDLCIRLCSLPVNVICCAHVSGQVYRRRGDYIKDEFVDAPGKMAIRITALFSDVWYSHIDSEGQHVVLTQGNDIHQAKNTVNADPICPNDYQEIVKNAKPLQWSD